MRSFFFRDVEDAVPYNVRANNGVIALRLSAKYSFSLLLFLLAEKFTSNTFRLACKKFSAKYFLRLAHFVRLARGLGVPSLHCHPERNEVESKDPIGSASV